jgi:hypothetical protein
MTKTSTETTGPVWLMAREPVLVVCGARPKLYRKLIVRDRHSGRLVEIDDTDPCEPDPNTGIPPNILDPGDEGRTYVFRKGEAVLSDHEACITSPGSFTAYIAPPRD